MYNSKKYFVTIEDNKVVFNKKSDYDPLDKGGKPVQQVVGSLDAVKQHWGNLKRDYELGLIYPSTAVYPVCCSILYEHVTTNGWDTVTNGTTIHAIN